MDERFGLYAGCNPDPSTGIFSCEDFGGGCWYDDPVVRRSFAPDCRATECACPAYEKKAVGRSVCNMCYRNASLHHDTPMWRQVEALMGTHAVLRRRAVGAGGGAPASATCLSHGFNLLRACSHGRDLDISSDMREPAFAVWTASRHGEHVSSIVSIMDSK